MKIPRPGDQLSQQPRTIDQPARHDMHDAFLPLQLAMNFEQS